MPRPLAVAPFIYDVTLTNAAQWYPQVLHNDASLPSIKKIQITCNNKAAVLDYSYDGGITFVTMPAGGTYWDDGLDAQGITVSVRGNVAGAVAQIQVWV